MISRPTCFIDIDNTIAHYSQAYTEVIEKNLAWYKQRKNSVIERIEKSKVRIKKQSLHQNINEPVSLPKRTITYQNSLNKIEEAIQQLEGYLYTGSKIKFKDFIYPQSKKDFFLNLKPIEDAKGYIELLKEHFDIYFLTRPSYLNHLCYTEKRLWVEKHYGLDMCNKLIICPNKALIKGHFLVDDVLWKDFEGVQIQYGNLEFTSWKLVYERLLIELKNYKKICELNIQLEKYSQEMKIHNLDDR